ncbi:hypothetical protein SLA2020_062960 [Shorea laevis]
MAGARTGFFRVSFSTIVMQKPKPKPIISRHTVPCASTKPPTGRGSDSCRDATTASTWSVLMPGWSTSPLVPCAEVRFLYIKIINMASFKFAESV